MQLNWPKFVVKFRIDWDLNSKLPLFSKPLVSSNGSFTYGGFAEIPTRSLLKRFESPTERPLSVHFQRFSSRFISLALGFSLNSTFVRLTNLGPVLFSGEVILSQKPYICVPNNTSSESRCDGCFKTNNLKKCSGCQVVWYCGSSCQV